MLLQAKLNAFEKQQLYKTNSHRFYFKKSSHRIEYIISFSLQLIIFLSPFKFFYLTVQFIINQLTQRRAKKTYFYRKQARLYTCINEIKLLNLHH